jgi:hypothetical protein
MGEGAEVEETGIEMDDEFLDLLAAEENAARVLVDARGSTTGTGVDASDGEASVSDDADTGGSFFIDPVGLEDLDLGIDEDSEAGTSTDAE